MNEILFFDEPLLTFGHSQVADDPKEGLFLYGPLRDFRKPAHIKVGVIGTPEGISFYRKWIKQVSSGILTGGTLDRPVFFPGFREIFDTEWSSSPALEIPVSPVDISRALRMEDRHSAIYETVSLYSNAIGKALLEDDISIDVWFVVVPEDVYVLGRPHSRIPLNQRLLGDKRMNANLARRLIREPSLFADDMIAAEPYKFDLNFHNQLKMRLIGNKVVTQIVRETTLAPELHASSSRRRLQDAATVAWNLSTSTFFKAGGRPWKLATIRKGVCYVGLIFKRVAFAEGNACCGAQMFLESGEGMVFKGAVGPWYSEVTREFHLSREKAKELMAQIVASYSAQNGEIPSQIFIHGQTRFNDIEWAGFEDAIVPETNLVGIRINRSSEIRLFRPGKHPPLRGTAYKYQDRRAALWTMGLIPKLGTYPGREMPNPLNVEICRGSADISVVLRDVLNLTKLNFNTCIFADGLPVTLRFANLIGEILTAGPAIPDNPLPFRHYI